MRAICKYKWITGFLCLCCITATAQRNMKVTAIYSLSGNGRFDYLASSDNGKLYVSHGDEVNIMDETTGKEIAVIEGLAGVHGIAFDYAEHKGYISNGKDNNVAVFDLTTHKVTATIATGKNPDGIIYEPYTKTIITGNGKSNSLSVIDPKTASVTHTVPLAGKPEAMVSDGKGHLFVNIEDKSEIQEIDLKHYKTIKTIPLLPRGEGPSGLAIDTGNKLLFSGCSNKTLMVINYEKGVIVKSYPIGAHCDAVAYNPQTQTIFSSNGDGTLTVLSRIANTEFKVSTVITKEGARTMALNTKTNTIYLSTADFSGQMDSNGKKMLKPNSFKILEVK